MVAMQSWVNLFWFPNNCQGLFTRLKCLITPSSKVFSAQQIHPGHSEHSRGCTALFRNSSQLIWIAIQPQTERSQSLILFRLNISSSSACISASLSWYLLAREALAWGLIPTAGFWALLEFRRNSSLLWLSMRMVSAVVMQPLHARQSCKETLATLFLLLIRSGFENYTVGSSRPSFKSGLTHSWEGVIQSETEAIFMAEDNINFNTQWAWNPSCQSRIGQPISSFPRRTLRVRRFSLRVEFADKTAEYVAKNGSNFEDLVMQKELSNPNFCFLRRDDPYRPYYENKITELARGLSGMISDISQAPTQDEEEEPTKKKPAQSKQEPPRKQVKAPPSDQFTVEQPRNLSAMDLDIIKHTAIFVAKNGKKFLVALTEREKMNAQYDFLKPSHDLFQFFSHLVDAYTKCLQPKKEEIDRLLQYVQDKQVIYTKCQERYEYEIFLKEEQDRKQQQDEDERAQMAMIDWNDFSIVETIDFVDDDRIDKIYEKNTQRFDKMDFKEPQFTQQNQLGQGSYAQIEQRIISTEKPKHVITLNATNSKAPVNGDQGIPVLPNYVRPTLQSDTILIKCEICGKNFPKNQINEHIQLELQDPKYIEIKRELSDRSNNSTIQPGHMIAEHLAQLKRKRPDIFEDDHRRLPPPPPPPPQRRAAPPPPPPPPK